MWPQAARVADELGFESLWMAEHLVLPVQMAGSPFEGSDHPPIPPQTPVFDVFGYLSYLAGITGSIRLGTHVYNLALRHPFVAARAVTTLDVVSSGRALVGIGAGWLRSEWEAAGYDFDSRGRRLDESLGVCRRLWTEEVVEHHGEFFDFGPVSFAPKPLQDPYPPVLIGGESSAALSRATRHDGWIGLDHTPASAAQRVSRIRREAPGHQDRQFSITVSAAVSDPREIDEFARAGVDRLIVAPWSATREVPEALSTFARRFMAT